MAFRGHGAKVVGRTLAGLFPHAKFIALDGIARGAMIDSHAEEILQLMQPLLQ
jgi:hypothetical protein